MNRPYKQYSAWPSGFIESFKKAADANLEAFKLRQQFDALTEQQKSELLSGLLASTDRTMNAAPDYALQAKIGFMSEVASSINRLQFDNGKSAKCVIFDDPKQREEAEIIKLSKLLDKDTLFRFAYVPFVIAELVWDYADTIIDLAIMMRLKATKKLCRAIRELRRDYDRVRAPFIDDAHRNSETENMYMFEDGVNDIFKTLLVNIRCDLKGEYPELAPDYLDLLTAVYQCDILLHSLFRYVRMQTEKIEKIVGHRIGRILPDEMYRLDALVIAFVGDKPVSERFISIKETYIKTLATQMALIELNEI